MSILNTISLNPALCNFDGPTYLFFSSNVAPLVHYSHLPITIISLIIGFFILFQNRKRLPNKILFCLTLAFSAWVFLDSIFWASNRSDVIMFVWSLQILFEPIVYISALYLLHVLIRKEDMSFNKKLIIALIYLPVIVLVPTKHSLSGFNVITCLSEEGPIALYYTYAIEILYTLWIVGFSLKEYLKRKTKEAKQEILLLTVGTVLLLLSFSFGNIIGSFTENWKIAQIGLFGMPVFIFFLAYSIVKFKLFNIKLIGANVLVITLWVATASLFAIQEINISHAVTAGTLILTTIFGFILINSVRKEVRAREEIEELATKLEAANLRLKELDQAKSDFISIASHQLRTPLTAIKGYSSMILEGSFGEISEKIRGAISKIFQSSQRLVLIISDFLDISRIEQGTMNYEFTLTNLDALVAGVVDEFKATVGQPENKKPLTISFDSEAGKDFNIVVDRNKIRQVVTNLIDNAIKYTPKGFIKISLAKNAGRDAMMIKVQDSGIGITKETMSNLFKKFSRAKGYVSVYADGSGLGLYVAKEIINAHHGKIWAESEGKDRGSTFFVELPTQK